MSRVKSFLVVGLAFSSVCCGAGLMQWTVARSNNAEAKSLLQQAEPACRALMDKHHKELTKNVAREIYNEAFKLSFNGQWSKAAEASECAAWLEHGSKKWAFEAKDLIN